MERVEYSQLGESCYFERLDNGLPVFVVPKPGYAKAQAMLAVSYGGMNRSFTLDGVKHDTPGGIAHYLEHKMFDMKEGSALTQLSAAGASANAFTASDMTAYYFSCTDRFLEHLRTLLRFVSTPYFTPESVNKERGIIAQEIRMYQDNPGHRVYENLLNGLYVNHPVRYSVLGTQQSIESITADTLYRCHEAFYTPEHMALCVVGDVDPHRICTMARMVLKKGEHRSVSKDYGEHEPMEAARQRVCQEMEVSEPSFLLGLKAQPFAPGEEGLRERMLSALSGELLCGRSSPLYARLYEQGLIHKDFSVTGLDYPGAAFLVAGGDSPDPDAVSAAILEEADRLVRQGIDPQRFQRAVRSEYGATVRSLNSFDNICVQLAKHWFSGCHYYEFARLYETLTPEDAVRFLQETAVPSQHCLSIIKPKGAIVS